MFFFFLSFFLIFFLLFLLLSGQEYGVGRVPKRGLEVGVHSGSVGQGAEATAPLLPRTFIPAEVGAESQNS